MAVNLVDLIKSSVPPDVVSKFAVSLGVTPTNAQTALNTGLPAILGGLVEKSSTDQGSDEIIKMIKEGGFDGSSVNEMGNILTDSDKTKALVSSGTGVLNSLFGDKLNDITNYISKSSNISLNSSSSLLGFLASVIMGVLGKQVSSGNLNAGGLSTLLSGQKNFLAGLLPSGLASIIGGTELTKPPPSTAPAAVEKTKEVVNKITEKASSFNLKKYLPWIVLGVVILAGIIIWRSCSNDKPDPKKIPTKKVDSTKKKVDTTKKKADLSETDAPKTGDTQMDSIIAALGKFIKRKLPNGTEIIIAQAGVERKLITFIEDKTKAANKETWFSFDRILFEPGSSKLKPSSTEQLKNITELMKAYPNVEIKIGGYTDSTGNADANLKLSQERANAVMSELVKLGVPANRMKAEGYGSKFPVAPNKTPAGRSKNRRIDIRVTKK